MPNNFITNSNEKTLKARIKTLIRHSKELKFLVGFFYFSGWRELYSALKEKSDLSMKILIGLDTDVYIDKIIEVENPEFYRLSQEDVVSRFFLSLKTALNDELLDTQEFYEQAEFFVRMLEEGRLQIRKTFEPNHAKLYLFRFDDAGQSLINAPGRFIIGSSNLTRAGLTGQKEFNVEIGDYGWKDAEEYFNRLWDNAIPITEIPYRKKQIVEIIRRQTQIATITPFEAYVLVLKTYIDMMEQKKLRPSTRQVMEERGYRIYRYQEEAVEQALSVLQQYGGVILADVVGLGKSVIASWIAREKGGRGIVICPPALIGDSDTKTTGWYKYLSDFGLYDWEVFSVGKLDKALEYLNQYGDDIKTVIVDEAHRFRNEDTEAYEKLSQICLNRDVILLTATPFNNTPLDIFALLKLFIPPGKSTLTLDEKLIARFARYTNEFRKLSYILRYYGVKGEKGKRVRRYYEDIFGKNETIDLSRVRQRVHKLAAEIRAIIEPVVIRRNRLDLRMDPVYKDEITHLSSVDDPKELFYGLTPEQSHFYDRVIHDYFGEMGRFKGAIYQPYLYEKGFSEEIEEEFTYTQQRNLYDFMRRLLVKRFESSFKAFAQSVDNFIDIHEMVLAFIEKTGKYVLERSLIEKHWCRDEETIEQELKDFIENLDKRKNLSPRHARIYEIDKFKSGRKFIRDIENDLALFREIRDKIVELRLIDDDPKIARLIKAVKEILKIPPESGEPRRKLVIFTEYLDTLRYISESLEDVFPGRVLKADKTFSRDFMRTLVANFDASYPVNKQRNEYDILVATDRLSEGVNLNRAGIIINYDIPWNPTRVIQRLGRINRIGKKVFNTLYIYNFFPTEQGAEIVKSREIAAHKMFLIHNTLGEDSKIFAPDETPTPAGLFTKINRNPEELESESLLTVIRRKFFDIKGKYPKIVEKLSDFPARVKTAKKFEKNELVVIRKKGLQLFIHMVKDTASKKSNVKPLTFEEALSHIKCKYNTPIMPLSLNFWNAYESVKKYRESVPLPKSEKSLWVRAENNLRSAIMYHSSELEEYMSFIRTLLRDIREFQILPRYTLRRLTSVDMKPKVSADELKDFKESLNYLRKALGDDYLERVEGKLRQFKSEIIIAVENIMKDVNS